eukprot:SAG11_NODE_17635_length_513_cov_0.756039_1_plen_112_part_01
MQPSDRNPLTGQSSRSHVPGYAGHCPAQREAIGKRFGDSTSDALYAKSRGAVWYGGETSPPVRTRPAPPAPPSSVAPPNNPNNLSLIYAVNRAAAVCRVARSPVTSGAAFNN